MAVAHRFAKEGYKILLASRESEKLTRDCSDLKHRYNVEVSHHEFDALKLDLHKNFIKKLPLLPNIVVSAVGYMGKQPYSNQDMWSAIKIIRSNFEGPANILNLIIKKFEERGSGTIIGISSVAGERGRASNYLYGSSKAGFTTFLSGLRNQIKRKDIRIITVLPGFVDTKMTHKFKLPRILTAQPWEVAEAIWQAVKKKRNIIYVKSIWRFIMLIVRNIPEIIFQKLKI